MLTRQRQHKFGIQKVSKPFSSSCSFPIFRILSRSHQGVTNPARCSPYSPENSPPDWNKRPPDILKWLYTITVFCTTENFWGSGRDSDNQLLTKNSSCLVPQFYDLCTIIKSSPNLRARRTKLTAGIFTGPTRKPLRGMAGITGVKNSWLLAAALPFLC